MANISIKWIVRCFAVRCIVWLGVSFSLWLIVLSISSDGKLSVAVVDVHETSCANAKVFREPRLYHDDELLANDFADPACNRSQSIATSCERNLESKLAIHKFDWTLN